LCRARGGVPRIRDAKRFVPDNAMLFRGGNYVERELGGRVTASFEKRPRRRTRKTRLCGVPFGEKKREKTPTYNGGKKETARR